MRRYLHLNGVKKWKKYISYKFIELKTVVQIIFSISARLFQVDHGADVLVGDFEQPLLGAAAVLDLCRHVLRVHLADVEQLLEARSKQLAFLVDALRRQRTGGRKGILFVCCLFKSFGKLTLLKVLSTKLGSFVRLITICKHEKATNL